MAAIPQAHDNERVGVEYKGPYSVSMNRYLLEKSAKSPAGKLLNKLRTPWIDCFVFVYPSDNRVLVYHNVKGKKEGVKWKFGVGEVLPTLTLMQYQANRYNVLVLEGLVNCYNTDSALKELMVSFETREDRKAFEKDVGSFTIAKKPEIKQAKKKNKGPDMAKISKLGAAMIRRGRLW